MNKRNNRHIRRSVSCVQEKRQKFFGLFAHTRRRSLITGFALVTLIIGCLWILRVPAGLYKERFTIAAAPISGKEKITELDSIIERVERNFLSTAEQLKMKIAKVQNPHLRAQLDLPRQVMLINKENPWRNIHRLHEKHQEGLFKQENINYFSYNLLDDVSLRHQPERKDIIASYFPVHRTLFFSREYAQMNILDFSVLAHELFHVTQDTKERSHLNTERQFLDYVNFNSSKQGEKPRIILNFETTAYALQLEILDLLLNGELRFVVTSKDMVRAARIGKLMNVRADQKTLVEQFIALAFLYFPTSATQAGLPQGFVIEIARAYRNSGNELYTKEGGRIRKIHPHELPD